MSLSVDTNRIFRSADAGVGHWAVHIDDDLFDLASQGHHLVTLTDVRAAGLTARQWRYRTKAGEWVGVAPGVWRHRSTPIHWRLEARAGLIALGPNAALYGRTAAAWWELGGVEVDVVEFVVPRSRRRDFPFVVHTTEQWWPGDLVYRDGVRLTSATRLVIDLADGSVTAEELERVIDDAVSRRLTSLPTLQKRLAQLSGSGRPGTPKLRALLLDSGGESYLERKFLRLVRRAGLPRPTCQVVHRSDGRRVARVDFQFPDTNVIVEVSGRLGHVTNSERKRDAERRNELIGRGHAFLEFTTVHVLDEAEYVVAALRRHLPVRVDR